LISLLKWLLDFLELKNILLTIARGVPGEKNTLYGIFDDRKGVSVEKTPPDRYLMCPQRAEEEPFRKKTERDA